jgi:ATP-binding cassette subfamily F protein 3
MAREDLYPIKSRLEVLDKSSIEYADLISRFYDGGGGEFDAQVKKVLAGFDIEEAKLDLGVSRLSGGEKTKIALARILLRGPDIMLLDEPTNHLEIASLEWLEEYLRDGTIPYIVISHDRRFLDNCVKEIWELKNKKLNVYAGNYSFYKNERDLEIRRQQQQYENQQKKISQLKAAANKRRQEASSVENFKFKRSISKKGSVQKRDAGSGRSGVSSSDKMRAAKAVEKRIEQMLEKEKAEKPRLDRERKITFSTRPLKTPVVLKVRNLIRSFGEQTIFANINLSVGNQDRLGIIGRNGSGKSTFLKIITGNLDAGGGLYRWTPQAEIGYFSQEHETLDNSQTILDEVLQGNQAEQTRARWILGRLNIRRDKVFQTVGTLSMGERSKVALAKILFSDVNILILDEPTNHIELSAREAFEDALDEYQGVVIVASHDRYLLDRITLRIFDIEKNRLFEGGYSEYIESHS